MLYLLLDRVAEVGHWDVTHLAPEVSWCISLYFPFFPCSILIYRQILLMMMMLLIIKMLKGNKSTHPTYMFYRITNFPSYNTKKSYLNYFVPQCTPLFIILVYLYEMNFLNQSSAIPNILTLKEILERHFSRMYGKSR